MCYHVSEIIDSCLQGSTENNEIQMHDVHRKLVCVEDLSHDRCTRLSTCVNPVLNPASFEEFRETRESIPPVSENQLARGGWTKAKSITTIYNNVALFAMPNKSREEPHHTSVRIPTYVSHIKVGCYLSTLIPCGSIERCLTEVRMATLALAFAHVQDAKDNHYFTISYNLGNSLASARRWYHAARFYNRCLSLDVISVSLVINVCHMLEENGFQDESEVY